VGEGSATQAKLNPPCVSKRAAIETPRQWRKHMLKVSPIHSGHDTAEFYVQQSENIILLYNSLPCSNKILKIFFPLPTQCQDAYNYCISSRRINHHGATCIDPLSMYTRLFVVSQTGRFSQGWHLRPYGPNYPKAFTARLHVLSLLVHIAGYV
jgi:hypothetical protein